MSGAAVTKYLALRGRRSGLFFRFLAGMPLSRESLVQKVREALVPSGVDVAAHSGHSFRIGAASTAAAVGIEDFLIKTLGRWESAAYLRYVKVSRSSLAGVSKLLVKS